MAQSMDIMSFHIRVWKICGIWPPTDPATPILAVLAYHLFTAVFYGICLIVFPTCMVLNLIFVSNLNGVIETLLICSTCVMASFKGICVMTKRTQLRRLFAIINQMDAFVVDSSHRSVIQVSLDESRRLLQMLSVLYYCGVTSAFVLSIIGSEEKQLMWPSWYPGVPWKENNIWLWSMRVYQFFCSLLVALLDSSVDIYGAALCKLLGAHLDVLSMRLSAIGVEEVSDSIVVSRKAETEVIECAKYYNLCLQFSEQMNDILSVHYTIQFACSGLIICVSAYKLSEIQPLLEYSMFLFLCEYLFSMTIEIYIPCYFGSVVTIKSEQLPRRIFQANWVDQSRRFQSSMRIFVERTLRPIQPLASGLVVIGLPTFVAILRAAYSLLSLLKSIDK